MHEPRLSYMRGDWAERVTRSYPESWEGSRPSEDIKTHYSPILHSTNIEKCTNASLILSLYEAVFRIRELESKPKTRFMSQERFKQIVILGLIAPEYEECPEDNVYPFAI